MPGALSHNGDCGDGFTARFLARLPPDLAASFTADQLDAIRRAYGMRYVMDHAVDLRRTLHLPWGRYYLVVLLGRDWRRDGGPVLLRTARDSLALAGVLALLLLGAGLVAAACGLAAPDLVVLAAR